MEGNIKYFLLKKYFNIKNKDVAKITGNTTGSVSAVTGGNTSLPRWLNLAIYVHEKHLAEKKQILKDVLSLSIEAEIDKKRQKIIEVRKLKKLIDKYK